MLRGPQTVAEVRTRASAARRGRQPRRCGGDPRAPRRSRGDSRSWPDCPARPGQKEARCAHLLSGEVTYDVPDVVARPPRADAERLAAVEEASEELRKEVADLRAQLEALRKQFEKDLP